MARHTRSVHIPEPIFRRIKAQADRLQRPVAWVLRRAWEYAEIAIAARAAPPDMTTGSNEDEAPEPPYVPKK